MSEEADRSDQGTAGVFFDGLPAMAGIVTVVAQPFAQDSLRNVLELPHRVPVVIAVLVSGLLAVHKVVIVRRSGRRECFVCIPLLMLMIFSAYATGNNLVYYAKEGSTKPDSEKLSTEEVSLLRQEREILQQRLKDAQDVIDTLGRVVKIQQAPTTKSRSWLPSLLGSTLQLSPREAEAQEPPRPETTARPVERADVQELRKKLRQYELQQQQSNKKLEELKRDERVRETPKQPFIKSW